MVTCVRASSVAVLFAALFSSQAAQAQSGAATYQPRRADVVSATAGRPLAVASSSAPERTVVDVLRARGRAAATLSTLHLVDARGGRAGARHLRFEQTVDGLPVYGAYAKAAFDRSGALVNLIDQLAPVPAAALAPAQVGAEQALRTALARLHPDASVDLGVAARGTVTTFVGGAFFHEPPTVTAVAVPLSDGSMTRGWLVETWTQRSNELHHTLVGGDGRILHVEKRTANDSYNIFPVSPAKGPQAVTPGPAAGNAESPIGWLSTSAAQKDINIIGNNVNAYLDSDSNNRADPGGTPVGTGNFLTAADLMQAPTTAGNKAVAVQNLFYLNNVIHDILYRHGFDEGAGNFQANNFANGGAGRDAVNAEGQDGGGTDNANFATPPDGRKPRMQMYLFTGAGPTHEVVITAPKMATYGAKGAEFGAPLDTTGLSGAIAAGTTPTDGCTAMSGVNGKIALVDRGTCDFTAKALNAQRAGATGLIVANNTGGTTTGTMGGTNRRVTIPAVMISQNDGASLRKLAAPTGTMRLKAVQPLQIDGGLDSDVVFHEYGHGLTWRMIGGMSGPLAGAIGEGASDGVAMLVNGDGIMGEYAASSALGIRRYPYPGYPLTYKAVTGEEVHNDGEIYAAVVWRLIELFGPARRSELFTYYVDAMNFIPATPSYEQMRDGMLQAVATGPLPADACTIWAAFAQFGIGVGSSGVANPDGTVTIVESFAKPGGC